MRLRTASFFKSGYTKAFFLSFLAAFFAFGWSIFMEGGLFALSGDFNSQQLNFAMYANDAIKSGHVIWDYSLDLGSNFIGGMAFYILGSPFFYLSLLFPSNMFMYVVGWLYILKYALAGLTSYAFIRRYVKNDNSALIASLLYAFSGFSTEALLFYHFHDVVAFFPLLLLGLDKLMEEKKRGPFLFAVFINAFLNYYFFVGEVIFVILYFLVKYFLPDIRLGFRRMGAAFLEAVLGVGLGLVLLLPAALFTLQNPRVTNGYYGSNSLVFSAERYLFILKGLLFPGEVMSNQSAVIESNFSTCNAYMPMLSIVLVIAFFFLYKGRKHWLKRMLIVCLIFGVVPILNASFSMFAGLYHRWFYMLVLIMATASAVVMDRWMDEGRVFTSPAPTQTAIAKACKIWAVIGTAFVLFIWLVPWNSKGESKLYHGALFWSWTAVMFAGILFTWFAFCKKKKRAGLFAMIMVYLFAVGTTAAGVAMYHSSVNSAEGIYERVTASHVLDLGHPEYRYDSSENFEMLRNGIKGNGSFCSTVSGSIFELYESLGLKRDVKSPEGPTGFANLISARYTFENEPREGETAILSATENGLTYYIYENEDVPPIGFTYHTYMTASEFEDIATEKRAVAMLKTLVVADEDEAKVSQVLRHYDASVDGTISEDKLTEISREHLTECSEDYFEETDSFGSTIYAEEDGYAFYSIPNDSGWSAEVNGEEAEIINVNGLMAVKVTAGENKVVFHYTVPGLKMGALGSAGSALLILLYLVIVKVRKGKKKALKA